MHHPIKIPAEGLHDYSTREAREQSAAFLLDYAARERAGMNHYWKRMGRYYDGAHDTSGQIGEMLGNLELPFMPAQCTDGYIAVESQIDAAIPDFEMSGRGGGDDKKASQREKIVRYILERNDMEFKNSRNERRLGICGSAVWKLSWEVSSQNPLGEVRIDNPHPSQIYPDPAARTVDGCEYIGYTYRMHRSRVKRTFGEDIKRLGADAEAMLFSRPRSEFVDPSASYDSSLFDEDDQSALVTEWYFRQPSGGEALIELADGKKAIRWEAGDIAMCIFVNGVELRYLPRFWNYIRCDMYPFVIYCKTPGEDTLWGRSELESVIPLIDASDRELAFAQINAAFMSNDIVVAEENAFSDDSEPDNRPGAVWKLRPGMMGKVARLGNLSYAEGALHNNTQRWRLLIQETTGNYDTYNGAEPTRVTTATGIALLNERARLRVEKKRVDRQAGFRRLYELLDRAALENYDDGRVIALGADEGGFIYRYADFASEDGYLPEVDVKINVGDGLRNSKAFTISALSDLIRTPITPQNHRIVQAFVRLIDIPQASEICEEIERQFGETPS